MNKECEHYFLPLGVWGHLSYERVDESTRRQLYWCKKCGMIKEYLYTVKEVDGALHFESFGPSKIINHQLNQDFHLPTITGTHTLRDSESWDKGEHREQVKHDFKSTAEK